MLPEKDKWKHTLYKGICKECGYERVGTINDFKKKITQCKHISSLSKEQFEEWFSKNKRVCLNCNKYIPFNKKESVSNYKKRLFCDNSCSASYNNKLREGNSFNYCIVCNNPNKKNNKFCSSKCFNDFYYNNYITQWKSGLKNGAKGQGSISNYVKKYLFEKYNNKCVKCGWGEMNQFTKKIPLEIHHKDGNYLNNNEDNLELLCPNCHSLTNTYKAANKGNGREYRRIHYNVK